MRKSPEEIKEILLNLNQSYLSTFNEGLDSSFVLSIVDEYLTKMRKEFVLNRIFGLKEKETLELRNQILNPKPVIVETPKVAKKESGKRSKV